MKLILRLTRTLFGNLSICALTGGIVGTLTGFFFGLLQDEQSGTLIMIRELLGVGLILAAAAWLFVVMLFGVWLRYGVTNIALPAFVNSVFTSTITVLLCNWVGISALAAPIGLFTGLAVGYLLCWWCRYENCRSGDKNG